MNPRLWLPALVLVPFLALTSYVLATVGMVGFYRAAFSSSATLLLATDLLLSLAVALLWMRADARERGLPWLPYLAVALATGAAGPLLYWIHRELAGGRREAAAPLRERTAS